jgi:hypothetical protein
VLPRLFMDTAGVRGSIQRVQIPTQVARVPCQNAKKF